MASLLNFSKKKCFKSKDSGAGHFFPWVYFSRGTWRVASRTVHKCFYASGCTPSTQSCPELLRHSGCLLRGCIFSWEFLFFSHFIPSSCCGGFQCGLIPTPASWLLPSCRYAPGIYVPFKMCYPHMVTPTSTIQSVRLGDWLDIKPKGKRGVKLG